MVGSFKIQLIKIDNWKNPCVSLKPISFNIKSGSLDILHLPSGYVSSIQALEPNAKLLVMCDYLLNEIKDEFKFEQDYFINAQ